MRENHAEPPATERGWVEKERGGSPRTESCANTCSGRTAGRRAMNTAEPVPLYLVPIAIAGEIRRFGGVISEIYVRRTGRHCYAIAVVTREGA
ncbi:hypothetical protein [Methanofollis tationis]|uniref:Uncharacterized protein n=1 Tax=Methanofollis tationis TaxID=81417 RepID=A0A7K4HNV8_9EURY|nr:hypothetical protein [Methanofollis tationis]NVO66941.1 hypothetical protein [Methanofollis tationis]